MAQAAEAQASLMRDQNKTGLWGTIAAGLGLIFSVIAIIVSGVTAWVAIKTARAEMRAYLAVNIGHTKKVFDPKNGCSRYFVDIQVLNTGKTPAYAVVSRARVVPLPFPLKDTPLPGEIAGEQSNTTLNPDQDFTMPCQTPIYASNITEGILAGTEIRLYALGRIEYRDAFGQRRYTTFCSHADWGREGKVIWGATARHNDGN